MILFKTILPVIFGGGSAYLLYLLVRSFFPLKTNPLWKELVFIGFLPVMTPPSYSNEGVEVLMFFSQRLPCQWYWHSKGRLCKKSLLPLFCFR